MVDPEKIKVAQIVRAPIGGIRKHVLSIIEGSSEKFDVFLITNEEAGDIKYETYKEKNDCRKIYNINIIDSPCFEDLVNIIKICKIISKEKIDVLHGHGAKGGLYARVVGLILRRKVIYTAHGGSIHTMHGRVKNLIYAYIEKILYYMTNYLVFESNFSMNEYSRRIHKRNYKFILNRNAIELPKDFENLKLNDIDPSENIVVGSFGLLRKIKGHDLLIESCSLLISEGLDISLKIYGSGEERKNLEELAKKFNFSERLEIHEYTNKIYEEMRSCHIVAQPSRFESFGYVPLEAICNGVSVVSSLEGGLREVMQGGDIGFCTELLNAQSLAEQIKLCINDKYLRLQKFELAKKIISEDFSQKKFINKFFNIYRQE